MTPPVKLYADQPARRTRQVVLDLLALAWVVLFAVLGRRVHDRVDEYAADVRRSDGAGRALADNLSGVGDVLGRAPFVGDDVRRPLDAAASGALDLAATGASVADSIELLGTVLGWLVLLVPLLLAAPYYLPARVRWIVTATVAARLLARDPDPDLWALRALVRQPVDVIARRVPGAAAGWRSGDPEVVAALAALELRSLGLSSGVGGRS
ncbi:hypothetical protein [Nocardioides marmoraquaticus]